MTAPARPRKIGKCSVCLLWFHVRADGKLRHHASRDGSGDYCCAGAHMEPTRTLDRP